MRGDVDYTPESIHETYEIEVLADKIEFDARRPSGLGSGQCHAATRRRLEQLGGDIPDLITERVPRRFAVDDRVHVVLRRAGPAGRISEAGHRMRPNGGVLPCGAPQVKADEKQRMVLQIGADAGMIDDHVDADVLEMLRRSNPRSQQHRGRMDAARAEDNFTGLKSVWFLSDRDRDAGHSASLAHKAGDLRAARDLQVHSPSHGGVEIADSAGGSRLFRIAHG